MSEKMKVETTERELIFTRVFDAPRELVFETFSSCEHLRNWWGPRQWPVSSCDMDFREGGRWNYCMKGPDGTLACGLAIYEEIVKPNKIVYTDYFTSPEGDISEDMPSGLVTYEFADQGERTIVSGRTLYPEASDLQTVLEMGVIEGMTETLDRLDEHLEQVKQTAE